MGTWKSVFLSRWVFVQAQKRAPLIPIWRLCLSLIGTNHLLLFSSESSRNVSITNRVTALALSIKRIPMVAKTLGFPYLKVPNRKKREKEFHAISPEECLSKTFSPLLCVICTEDSVDSSSLSLSAACLSCLAFLLWYLFPFSHPGTEINPYLKKKNSPKNKSPKMYILFHFF